MVHCFGLSKRKAWEKKMRGEQNVIPPRIRLTPEEIDQQRKDWENSAEGQAAMWDREVTDLKSTIVSRMQQYSRDHKRYKVCPSDDEAIKLAGKMSKDLGPTHTALLRYLELLENPKGHADFSQLPNNIANANAMLHTVTTGIKDWERIEKEMIQERTADLGQGENSDEGKEGDPEQGGKDETSQCYLLTTREPNVVKPH